MIYKIDDIKTDARISADHPHARLIVYVSFWLTEADQKAGNLPRWREGFYMDVPETITRIVRDGDGLPLDSASQPVDVSKLSREELSKIEWLRETVKADVPGIVKENIERYIARLPGEGKRGARFDKQAQPSTTDAKGVLADAEAIKGEIVEVVK